MDFAKRDGTQNERRDGNNFFVNFGTFGCTTTWWYLYSISITHTVAHSLFFARYYQGTR